MASSSEAWSSGFSVWVGGPGLGWAGLEAGLRLGLELGVGLGWAGRDLVGLKRVPT